MLQQPNRLTEVHQPPGVVHVALGWCPRADVEQLPDAFGGQEPHRPAEKRTVGPDQRGRVRLNVS